MSKPVLYAVMQPQQWIYNDAVDSGQPIGFEAGQALLALNANQIRRVFSEVLKESGQDLDILAEGAGMIGDDHLQHSGPFYVKLDVDELRDFCSAVGIEDVNTLTDSELSAVRENYASLAMAPSP